MAEGSFRPLVGCVQQFPNKDVITEREAGDGTARDFTIKLPGKETLVSVTVFDSIDFPVESIVRGAWVGVDGKLQPREYNGKTYFNYTADSITILGETYTRAPREVVNQRSASSSSDQDLEDLL